MIIGICGKSGSGKSTFARQIISLCNKETIYLEIDKVGHRSLEIPEAKRDLIQAFGKEILTAGKVDRKKLGSIVFTSEIQMRKLTDITWKYMQVEIDSFLEENKNKVIILDWILLPKSKYFEMCDLRILLDIPYDVRKQRVIKRDTITEAKFDLREQASLNYDPENFDYVFQANNEEMIKGLVRLL